MLQMLNGLCTGLGVEVTGRGRRRFAFGFVSVPTLACRGDRIKLPAG